MARPWISTNLAISADGKISPVARIPAAWTSKEDHARLLELRRNADALLVGRGTWMTDRMTMTVPGRLPLRCVVSASGDFDADHPMFSTPGGPIHLLVTGDGVPPLSTNATTHRKNLTSFLETLATDHGVRTLHCEGGGQLIRALAELGVIDEFHLTLAAHTLFGGGAAPTATGVPKAFLPASLRYELAHFDPRPDLGECFLSYRKVGEI